MSQGLTEQFKAFVANKPADEEYQFYDIYNCAVGQFVGDNLRDYDDLHRHFGCQLRAQPQTFGALLDRLNALEAEAA